MPVKILIIRGTFMTLQVQLVTFICHTGATMLLYLFSQHSCNWAKIKIEFYMSHQTKFKFRESVNAMCSTLPIQSRLR